MAEASYPDDLRYHDQHDWVRLDGDDSAVFGKREAVLVARGHAMKRKSVGMFDLTWPYRGYPRATRLAVAVAAPRDNLAAGECGDGVTGVGVNAVETGAAPIAVPP